MPDDKVVDIAKNKPYTRLSVNIALDVADALREHMARRAITATEAVRRAIAIWALIEEAQAEGKEIHIVDPKNSKTTTRLTLI